jgi:hypothetical protein
MSDSGSTCSNGSVPFSTSIPSSANADEHEGKHALQKDLRLVVMSRLAYRMCHHFNELMKFRLAEKSPMAVMPYSRV